MTTQSAFEQDVDNAIGKWAEAAFSLNEVPIFVYVLARNLVSIAAASQDPAKAIEVSVNTMYKLYEGISKQFNLPEIRREN